jgi:hypothetical protein
VAVQFILSWEYFNTCWSEVAIHIT